ncbi:MAG TPA: tRNA pseudouridine(13) synthase TruD [Oleiagrimonas sp.]|nr:tRNA pseudouridine(13) synthase TruD [Oleiagrimonas sp.]
MDLPFAHGGPPLIGRLRATPEDFRVTEILGYAADGEGEHVLLDVEKREANTAWVAGELARFAGVKPMAVGYAGLKDRHAVTRQAFSVQLAGREEPDWSAFPHAGVRILSSARHRRKLKRGALEANDFVLVMRDVQGDRERAEDVLSAIAERGVPNYFGEQRFGHGGANVERARAMFAGRRMDRATRSILLSAARSQIFNEVLATRVRDGNWDQAIDGEVWCLAGSHARFGPEAFTDVLRQRLTEGDIHPSGPLWGRGDLPTQAQARQLEQGAVAAWRDLATGLEQAGLEQERRPLRLIPRHLHWRWLDETSLELSFRLPPGTYATVLMRELADAPQQASIS